MHSFACNHQLRLQILHQIPGLVTPREFCSLLWEAYAYLESHKTNDCHQASHDSRGWCISNRGSKAGARRRLCDKLHWQHEISIVIPRFISFLDTSDGKTSDGLKNQDSWSERAVLSGFLSGQCSPKMSSRISLMDWNPGAESREVCWVSMVHKISSRASPRRFFFKYRTLNWMMWSIHALHS